MQFMNHQKQEQAYKSIVGNIPFLNLILLKTAFDYAIGYQMLRRFSRSFKKDGKENEEKDTGQEFLLTKPSTLFKGFDNMTISSTTVKNSYSGDNSTATFSYTFKIFAGFLTLQVIIRSSTGTETVKTITTHYTVSGAGDANGGSVTFTAGNIPTNTETVVLRRVVPQTQAIDYIANDPFPAESHEEGLIAYRQM